MTQPASRPVLWWCFIISVTIGFGGKYLMPPDESWWIVCLATGPSAFLAGLCAQQLWAMRKRSTSSATNS